MLLRELFAILLLISAVGIVMNNTLTDLDAHGYEFESNISYTKYSTLDEISVSSGTSQNNLENSNREFSTDGDSLTLIESVGNVLSMTVNSIDFVGGEDGVVASASDDLGLNTGNAWIKSLVITLFVIFIVFMIASLWLRHKA